MADQDSGRGVVNIDLSAFSLAGRTSVHPVMFMLGIFAWAFVLLGLAAIGGGELAVVIGLLSLVLIFGGFIWTSVQRLSSSTTGRKDPFLAPEHLAATPPTFTRSFAAIFDARAVRQQSHGADASWRKDETQKLVAAQRLHATSYVIGGMLVILFGIPLAIAVLRGGALLGPGILLVIAGGFGLFTRGRRAMLASADVAMRDDPRPPILFLRSFKDDKVKLKQRVHVAGLPTAQPIRFEEALGFMVRGYGPFLAVGEPGEGLPQLGAARAYLSDDKWQEAVLTWIRQSQLIVMLCGPTKWIHWEVQNIVAAGALDRLLLMLPPGRGAKVQPERRKLERWDNILKSLEDTPYGPSLKALDISDVLMIRFQPDGQVVAYRSRGDFVQDYELAATLAIDSIAKGPPSWEAPAPVQPDLGKAAINPPDALNSAPDVPLDPPVDRLLPLKLAGFAALAGVVAAILPRTGLGQLPDIIFRSILLAGALGAGIALFYDRRQAFVGWFAGMVAAGYVVGSLGVAWFRPPFALTWLMVVVGVLGALSLRFKSFRDPLSWGVGLGANFASAYLSWTIIRKMDGGMSVAMASQILPWVVLAACIGFALTRRRATL